MIDRPCVPKAVSGTRWGWRRQQHVHGCTPGIYVQEQMTRVRSVHVFSIILSLGLK